MIGILLRKYGVSSSSSACIVVVETVLEMLVFTVVVFLLHDLLHHSCHYLTEPVCSSLGIMLLCLIA